MSTENFNQTEAESKVGRRVQTRVSFLFVPKGSQGIVTSAAPAAIARVGESAEAVYDVAVQWDNQTTQMALEAIAHRIEKADENENTIERFFSRDQLLEAQDFLFDTQSGKSLVDWFTKDEYTRYLSELSEAINSPDGQ